MREKNLVFLSKRKRQLLDVQNKPKVEVCIGIAAVIAYINN